MNEYYLRKLVYTVTAITNKHVVIKSNPMIINLKKLFKKHLNNKKRT